MEAWIDLFSTDYGLMSLAVIIGVIIMAGWFLRYFLSKIDESERTEKRSQGSGPAAKSS